MLVGNGVVDRPVDSGANWGLSSGEGCRHRRTFRIRGLNSCEECLTGEKLVIKSAPPSKAALAGGQKN